MGTDRPDDADAPSADDHSDRSADGSESTGGGELPARARAARIEARSREEYCEDLRTAIAEQRPEPPQTADSGHSAKPPEQAADGKSWEEITGWSRRVWAEYQRKWPPGERVPADTSGDRSDSRGEGNRASDRAPGMELERECDLIAKREEEKITPALLEIESRDPDRHLVGLEYRLKGRDRLKEKVAEASEQYGRSLKETISDVPDAIRYTFQYEETRYSQCVQADVSRLKDQGFELVTLKNSWSKDQYKGINSQWIDPESGQRFELQFHTHMSFEAKQITHPAYERQRSQPRPAELETMVLRAFQREVSAAIRVPPGAEDIPDYPERVRNAG